MSTFHIHVEAGCGLSLAVEAETEDIARLAALSAMADHMAECGSLTIESVSSDPDDRDPDGGVIIAIPGDTAYVAGYRWADE